MMDDGDQFILRKRKMDNQSVDDLFSDLPLSIIHCILARIPIRDAVRTCVLSSKWRYKWASLPHLVFDYRCVNSEGKTIAARRDCFNNFITNALFLHKGPVHKFEICMYFEIPPPDIDSVISSPDIDQWLLYLSMNEIREIILHMRYFSVRPPLVHSCLYSCQKLTHLELSDCELRPPPLTFKGFSFLRSLSLHHVVMPSTSLESLIAKSPLLEKFTYHTLALALNSELRISAPKLKYIYLTSNFKAISLSAPLLAKVLVTWAIIQSPAEQLQQKSRVCTYAKFFGSLTNLEKLTAEGCFAEVTNYLSTDIESCDHSLVFHHLKSIRLQKVSFEDKKQLAVVGHLIMGAPNLRELTISICTGDESDESDASRSTPNAFSDFGCPPNFTFKRLRIVEINQVCGLPCEMGLIKYLLKCSPRLQKMYLSPRSKLLPKVRLNLATKVLRYRRASPKAAIVLL